MAYPRLIAAIVVAVSLAAAGEPSARDLYKKGRKYEKKGDIAAAYLMYSQAAAADPKHSEYWQRAQALQRKAVTAANVMPQSSLLDSVPESAPAPITAATEEEIIAARKPQPPIEVEAPPVRKSFDIRADAKSVWEQATKAYGLEVVFDGDYQAGPVFAFRMTDADYREALNALNVATGSFFVPISTRLLLVVKDTEQKRREVENTAAISIPIPDPVTVQEAQELARSVQQVMEIQRFAIDSAQRLVIFRDRISKVRPAELLLRQLLGPKGQVAIEVSLLTVGKSSTLGLGIGVPTSFPISTLPKMITLAGGGTPLALAMTVANMNVLATATRSEANTLYQAELRSVDGQPASLHVGEKYPIMTMSYIGQVPQGQTAYTPPPSFNFEDLGLVLKITPKVHDDHEVSLDVETEFRLLGSASLNGIPVVSNRQFASRVRLRFNEAAIISGLLSSSDIRTLSGPAGLLNIPILGPALGTLNRTKDDVQVLVVIKPRLLTLPPTEATTHEIWVGSESRPRIPL